MSLVQQGDQAAHSGPVCCAVALGVLVVVTVMCCLLYVAKSHESGA